MNGLRVEDVIIGYLSDGVTPVIKRRYRTWTPPGNQEAGENIVALMQEDKNKARQQRGRQAPPRTSKDKYPSSETNKGIRRIYDGKLGSPRSEGQKAWKDWLC